MIEIDQGWTASSGGAGAAREVTGAPIYSVLVCEASTIASTQSFAFQTAAHSTGPWVTEGSTSVSATATVTSADLLRLTGPYGWVRPNLLSASSGTFAFRLIGVGSD